jgi:hypothetical protein
MLKFNIINRFSGAIKFTADINCDEDTPRSLKLGLAVKWAIENEANLSEANLRGANLSWANLSEANLSEAKGLKSQPAQTVILPAGDLIVYKKLIEGVAKLKIPAGAERSNATGRKCRAEYAEVLELPLGINEGTSFHDHTFKYRVGETIRPHNWGKNWAIECAPGIHFFITEDEAKEY